MTSDQEPYKQTGVENQMAILLHKVTLTEVTVIGNRKLRKLPDKLHLDKNRNINIFFSILVTIQFITYLQRHKQKAYS